MPKRKYRTLGEVSEEYYRDHPEELDDYLKEVFDEYAKDRNTPALLSSLRVVCRCEGCIRDFTGNRYFT
jgi:hypothetical protein